MHSSLQARRVTTISKTAIGQTLTIENTDAYLPVIYGIYYVLSETCDKLYAPYGFVHLIYIISFR